METDKVPQGPEINPKIGRFIEVLNIAERVALVKYDTTINGLRSLGEPTNDYSKIGEVIAEADRIVGPEEQFVSDYQMWKDTRSAGSHKMGFNEWKMARNEAYKLEYERLQKESGGEH